MFVLRNPEHGVLDAEQEVGTRTLRLRARQIRLDRTGLVSALVALVVDTTPIHSDWVTVDKASDRHSFANAVYGTKYTPGLLDDGIKAAYDQRTFEQDLMLWSRALYPRYIGASSGQYEHGDAEPSAPRWSVPGLVLEGQTSIWFGDAKAGKSTLQRLTAQALNHGVYDIIPVRGQEPAAWVNAEEDPGEHTRQLGNVNQALGIQRDAPLYTIHARGMGIEDLTQRLERATREEGFRHIFVDSLSRLARGLSLNENQTATLLMDSLGGLGPSVNWIGHTGQDNTHRMAGSKHFENAARLMVRVQSRTAIGGVSPELRRGVRATVTRSNNAAPVEPMHWTYEYHRDYGLMAVSKADESTWPVLSCDYLNAEARSSQECGRKTWDGVTPTGHVRCARHRGEEDEW